MSKWNERIFFANFHFISTLFNINNQKETKGGEDKNPRRLFYFKLKPKILILNF